METNLKAYGWGVREEHSRDVYDYKERSVYFGPTTTPTWLVDGIDDSDEKYWFTEIVQILVGVWYAYPQYATGYWSEPWRPNARYYPAVEPKPKIIKNNAEESKTV